MQPSLIIKPIFLLLISISVLFDCRFAGAASLPAEPSPGSAVGSNTTLGGKATLATEVGSFEIINDIPARLQWYANNGYCGETSFINAGLYYGQYLSQFDVRAIASPNKAQNQLSSQLLLGTNDTLTATKLHLNAVTWKNSKDENSNSFLAWVKSNVVSKYPVIIGVYTNENKFYGKTDDNEGDPNYDHIVTVIGVKSKKVLNNPASYYSDDILKLSDHGLWTGTDHNVPQYIFNYALNSFPATRQQANGFSAPIYSLPLASENFGIAITGVSDLDGNTVPVRLTTSTNGELPPMEEDSNARPISNPLSLVITVSNLKPNIFYNLYRYNTLDSVPNSSFNKNASKAFQKWPIRISSGSTFVMMITINSNEIAIFRALPSEAP